MAVPAHDTRDFDFAKKFNLPIIEVIRPIDKTDDAPLTEAYVEMLVGNEGLASYLAGGYKLLFDIRDETETKMVALVLTAIKKVCFIVLLEQMLFITKNC